MPFTRIEGEQPTVPVQVYSTDRTHFQWGDLCARRSALRAAQRKDKRKRLRVLFENGGDERVAVGRIREVAGRRCTATRRQRKQRRADRIERNSVPIDQVGVPPKAAHIQQHAQASAMGPPVCDGCRGITCVCTGVLCPLCSRQMIVRRSNPCDEDDRAMINYLRHHHDADCVVCKHLRTVGAPGVYMGAMGTRIEKPDERCECRKCKHLGIDMFDLPVS